MLYVLLDLVSEQGKGSSGASTRKVKRKEGLEHRINNIMVRFNEMHRFYYEIHLLCLLLFVITSELIQPPLFTLLSRRSVAKFIVP
jgi:hypothetical protein